MNWRMIDDRVCYESKRNCWTVGKDERRHGPTPHLIKKRLKQSFRENRCQHISLANSALKHNVGAQMCTESVAMPHHCTPAPQLLFDIGEPIPRSLANYCHSIQQRWDHQLSILWKNHQLFQQWDRDQWMHHHRSFRRIKSTHWCRTKRIDIHRNLLNCFIFVSDIHLIWRFWWLA